MRRRVERPTDPCAWFDRMIEHCFEYAAAAKAAGRPVVGILCEYTPRELIMAAGGVPVCLCGGSAKTIPAAEQHLPANLCPLIKSTFGYHVLRQQSVPGDGRPGGGRDDLRRQEEDVRADGRDRGRCTSSNCRTRRTTPTPWSTGFGNCEQFRGVPRRSGSPRTLRTTRFARRSGLLNRERRLRRELAALMKADRPPLTGRQLLDCKSSIWGMPEATASSTRRLLEDLRGKREQARARGDDRVRVLMTGVPMVHGAERVLDIVEQSGGLVVAMENCTGLKPILEDVDETAADPLRALAEKYFHLPCSVMTPNDRRLDVARANWRPTIGRSASSSWSGRRA